MRPRFCFVYPWATLGGVERVLLNRLIAFNDAGFPFDVDIMFLHDSGGAQPLRNTLKALGIEAQVLVERDFAPEVFYDMVFCIDCPQAFELCERRKFRFIAECHTSYVDNRKYLLDLPAACELIVTPSTLFGSRIRSELHNSKGIEVFELDNFVPWDISESPDVLDPPGWKKRPILFFGRMDKHKDPVALLDAFGELERKKPGSFFCILCGPQSTELDISNEVHARKLFHSVLTLPPVSFGSTTALLDLVKKTGGIFVSPSKGESFGLAAAEAICAGLPVVLSDIQEHRELVSGEDEKFTYRLGDVQSLGERIEEIFLNYEDACASILEIRERFSSVVFLEKWDFLLRKLNIQ